jgi:hypothetical protein
MSIISLCRLGEWVKVFNDTFCIVHPALTYNFWWPHWYLQPFLSMVFLLYLVGQFYCLEKPEYSEKTIVLSQFTEKMYHIKLYRVHLPWTGFKLIGLVVIGTDCTCSRTSNYHSITTTMANWSLLTDLWYEMFG